ncbi:oxidoreductase, short-chain dehydrogenase/reductase family [Aspergillus alliaceus]|uniref:oxidoreductase, short-chain dehydrogenase/reductase family n=1 Tax=Petromyces alliaceus TaxID=209559 RepID=UPI0012A653B9|nr:putative NADP(+)-dependent dehydrogenase [Aspergillus alliaceus]KAB8239047.1 putative NADP(+)-dependent dehydrogenase [Aspergillus alliaceus]
MSFLYKHVLLIGATAGIGRAMADRLVEAGAKVTAVGRRKDRLDKFVQKHGEQMASAVPFDISVQENIPKFAAKIIDSYPDVDCLFLNTGIQLPFELDDRGQFDLEPFNKQMNVNYSSLVALTHAFLPFLIEKKSPTSIIFTGSNMAIVPAASTPAYSASKAALNVFTLCLRDRLQNSNVAVIEISPPVVQTELHHYKLGMPLDNFADLAFKGLLAGQDHIVIGSIGPAERFNAIVDQRRAASEDLAETMSAQQK